MPDAGRAGAGACSVTRRHVLLILAILVLAALMFFSPGEGLAPVFFGDGR